MQEIKIVSRWDSEKVLLCGKYESMKECLEKNRGANLVGADLGGAYLRGADLGGAYLRDANLRGANLRVAKNYVNSHDVWIEITRRQPVETFTEKEWSIIGVISVHRICWDAIQKRYGKDIIPIFQKCKDAGFGEWLEYYENKIIEQAD